MQPPFTQPIPKIVWCAVYTRHSSSNKEDLSSCDVQREDCLQFIASHKAEGWIPLFDRFDDEAASGATLDRPALQRMLELVRRRRVDIIVVHRFDRLARSVAGYASIIQELRKFGVRLAFVTAPDLGHTASDNFMLNLLVSFAEFEREMIAGRIADARAAMKSRGLRIAGAVPFGFEADLRTKQLVPVEEEASVVRWMFERAAAGELPARIADLANAQGWRTKSSTGRRSGKTHGGNLWTARQVLATLRNPVYIGRFHDRDGTRHGEHASLVTKQVFDAVATLLDSRRTRIPGAHYEIKWPLQGRLYCAQCDRLMSPQTNRYRNRVYLYYRCRSTAGGVRPCGRQVSAWVIESAVTQKVSTKSTAPSTDAEIWEQVEQVVYDPRTTAVLVRLVKPDAVEPDEAESA